VKLPHWSLAVCIVLSLAHAQTHAGDLTKVERTIAKEPKYQGKPQYALLVFGQSAKDRVWLVKDGATLYVDRRGKGDLTDPKDKSVPQKSERSAEEYGYTFEVGDVSVSGQVHKGLTVSFTPLKLYSDSTLGKRADVRAALAKDQKAMIASFNIDVNMPDLKGGSLNGRVTFSAGPLDLTGVLQFGDSPANAPVVHFGGPLHVTFYGGLPTLRIGRQSDLVLVVGTPGVGPGTFAEVHYEGTIPKSAKPIADIAFPAAKPGDAAIKERFKIKDRC
jgi:hypothetical protein